MLKDEKLQTIAVPATRIVSPTTTEKQIPPGPQTLEYPMMVQEVDRVTPGRRKQVLSQTLRPSAQELSSLNLKEGENIITFSVKTQRRESRHSPVHFGVGP